MFRVALPAGFLHKIELRYTDDHAENVSLYELRVGTAVLFAVQHHFTHAGTEFVGTVDLAEKGPEDRIFGIGDGGFRVEQAKAVRAVRIVGGHFAALNDKPGRNAAGILAVDQNVCSPKISI